MASKKIKGRIIRILDNKSVVINLGREHGIGDENMFFILGEPEPVVDPVSREVLGSVMVTKGKVRSSQVFDKFTIATTAWTTITAGTEYKDIFGDLFGQVKPNVDEALLVRSTDVKPWKAKSETPVKVGDEVEVKVDDPIPDEQPRERATDAAQQNH